MAVRKLVRVIEERLTPTDLRIVKRDGYLWWCEKLPEAGLVYCVSLATGNRHHWYKHEVEQIDDAEA